MLLISQNISKFIKGRLNFHLIPETNTRVVVTWHPVGKPGNTVPSRDPSWKPGRRRSLGSTTWQNYTESPAPLTYCTSLYLERKTVLDGFKPQCVVSTQAWSSSPDPPARVELDFCLSAPVSISGCSTWSPHTTVILVPLPLQDEGVVLTLGVDWCILLSACANMTLTKSTQLQALIATQRKMHCVWSSARQCTRS